MDEVKRVAAAMIDKAFEDYRRTKEPSDQQQQQQYQQIMGQVQQQQVQFDKLKEVTERVVEEAKVKFAEGNQLS